MKKILSLLLAVVLCVSVFAMPAYAAATNDDQATATTVEVPSAFGYAIKTMIRSIMNAFRGIMNLPPQATSVNIGSGPVITLEPKGTNATVKAVYYFEKKPSGTVSTEGHTSPPENAKSCYIVVVTSDGLVFCSSTPISFGGGSGSRDRITVKFDSGVNNGNDVSPVTGLPENATVVFPSGKSYADYTIPDKYPQRYGYTFEGYSLVGGQAKTYHPGETVRLSSNTTFKAKWSQISYDLYVDLGRTINDDCKFYFSATRNGNSEALVVMDSTNYTFSNLVCGDVLAIDGLTVETKSGKNYYLAGFAINGDQIMSNSITFSSNAPNASLSISAIWSDEPADSPLPFSITFDQAPAGNNSPQIIRIA